MRTIIPHMLISCCSFKPWSWFLFMAFRCLLVGAAVALWGRCCWKHSFAFAAGSCVFVLALCTFFLCLRCVSVKHAGATWISRFCQLCLVLSFPWARMTPDICSTRGSRVGKRLACCRDCTVVWACRCQEGSVSALAPGNPCVWVKLGGGVGSAGSIGAGAEGVERCSCSINTPDRLKSRD